VSTQETSAPVSVRDRIAEFSGAMKAEQLADILSVSPITIYNGAKKGTIPSFRIGTCVRFCPKTVSEWIDKH
jgi:excisionase family DNA binding protein